MGDSRYCRVTQASARFQVHNAGMNEKRIILCDQDFSTMSCAQSVTTAPNIALSKTVQGWACVICSRFYSPSDGYFSLVDGKIVYSKKARGCQECDAPVSYMALTVNQDGKRFWQCMYGEQTQT
jgi:hypothetical protein